ncbi:hypothetical protein ACFL0M_03880 [Thermodesulfobacteriota bacterium]
MRPSVQASLYQFLHSDSHLKLQVSWAIKSKIINFLENSYVFLSQTQSRFQKRYPQLDVLFTLTGTYDHQLGIQEELAKICSTNGFKSGLIGLFHRAFLRNIHGFDSVLPLGMLPVSLDVKKSISDQCRHLYLKLQESDKSNLQFHDAYNDLVQVAIQIEQFAVWNHRLLEFTEPRIAILNNSKDPKDVAMQIACDRLNIPSMLIPHGFPQKSQYPISANFVMSYAGHHDKYLKKLCRNPKQVKSLGWLEPRKTLFYGADHILKNRPKFERRMKYNILFFAQLSGSRQHRCNSLSQLVPDVIKALNKMKEVETITIRLRPSEMNNPVIERYLKQINCSKLKISLNKSIYSDLKANNLLMSFSSTGLLYGPYLNMKSIEIRDDGINSVWPNSILPSQQVYKIGQAFHPIEFREFVLESPVINGEEVFYNRGHELERFVEFISTTL